MALSLRVRKGSRLEIGGETLEVLNTTKDQVQVSIQGKAFTLTEFERAEVLPQVFISLGDVRGQTASRIAIEAPRSIPIIRLEG